MLDLDNLAKSFSNYKNSSPYNHCIIDNFLDSNLAQNIDTDFLDYDSPIWVEYNNKNQVKKMYNDWFYFPRSIYHTLYYLNSPEFVDLLSDLVGCELYSDPGLHSGGCHIHRTGGFLSPHLDYSQHPKLPLYRKLNLIVFVSEHFDRSYGGDLELWEGKDKPLKVIEKIEPLFNRAAIFDTTQDSWHSVSEIKCPNNVYRKSLAVYYLTKDKPNTNMRLRANFDY